MTRPLFPLALLALSLTVQPAVAGKAPVLVELFTSEGCSSCPPADRLLGELAQRDDVLPLAFHVTYWDQMGWRDSFGDRRYTDRQRDYAQMLGSSHIYTPQMVIDGRVDVVGSDAARALAAVRLLRERDEVAAIAIADGKAALPATDLERPATLWMAAFDGHHRVAVTRGENAGQTLDHYNAVRELDRLGSWDGSARTIDIPVERLRAEYRVGVAVIAQDPRTGRVVALGELRL